MSVPPVVSIIICTCNRADDLRQTLAAVAQVSVPEQMPTELLVVDNASTDATAEVVASCRLPHMPVRYIHEPRRGKGYAYNTGMAAAQGEVFLFTDDDVRPPKNWIVGICGPILRGEADAVAGGVRIADHLERPWMETLHRNWLASTEGIDADKPNRMVGANMAFSREVLNKVPKFDVELGPGALGFADETVFCWNLSQAGYKIASALDVCVVHHFDPARLSRESFLNTVAKFGKVDAYLMHHYFYSNVRFPYLRALKHYLQLALLRVIKRKECCQSEGSPLWELDLVREVNLYKQWSVERKRPRRYEERGFLRGPNKNRL